jgi:hypothetical protein
MRHRVDNEPNAQAGDRSKDILWVRWIIVRFIGPGLIVAVMFIWIIAARS